MSDYDPLSMIIEEVAQPVEITTASGRKGRSLDLGPHEAALRRLLREAYEIYMDALDDWETRTDADKPKARLGDNWDPVEPGPAHDYGDMAGVGRQDWDEHWRRFYYRRPGNPGRGTTGDLPVEPLHAVYALVRGWWLQHIGRAFNPTYTIGPRAEADAEAKAEAEAEADAKRNASKDMAYFNPAGRLFLLVAQEAINLRYTARNCYGVHETARKKRQRRAK